ncbi:DUF4037 domain-containing protein [Clostridium tagluense]|uniref:DUF4037 domain-containing protein n=1 Tax=Clostridium tagluense TaxID=360422 RepID=UPI001C6F4130|nr:DUF4037 domain-containing protein [Clostridium tagluense]MBW9159109.1 DUF4037 domain-containing protein [Clostridium tagluense]WLC68065.1 DUF4037 domain-containing protein [Clostridium tagluense]
MSKDIFNKECEARIKLAREIASKCSIEYGREIIIVGSVSRNLADEDSDIEIEFLVDNLISEENMINWIKQIGGKDIHPYGVPLWDGSVWIIFKYKNYWIESGWQTISNMKNNINSIIEGKVITHDKLILASVLKDAIFIRGNGILSDLQGQLNLYPKELQKDIIANTIEPWTMGLAIDVRKMLSKREDKIPFLQRMIPDVQKILRILYAINRQWEPDWKWTKYIISNLEIKPENLKERIDSIICIKDTKENLKNCFELIKDTLLLIPKDLELGDTVAAILKNIDTTTIV